MEYKFQHVPQAAVRGQVLADFLADHPSLDIDATEVAHQETTLTQSWVLQFDRSVTHTCSGAGLVICSPTGKTFRFMIRLAFQCTNNQAEYEALVQGLLLLKEADVDNMSVQGDSLLIIQQAKGEYQCRDLVLQQYCTMVQRLSNKFKQVKFHHIYRVDNWQANDLAQMASEYKEIPGDPDFTMLELGKPAYTRVEEIFTIMPVQPEDWREPIKRFLINPTPEADARVRRQAVRYILIDQQLYRRTEDEIFLRCVGLAEAELIMMDVHEGLCGAHQSGRRMAWLIKRYGYFWPTLVQDCIAHAKHCQECQRHGPIQRVPATPMQVIVKPWPFRLWAMDVIGMIYPPSSRGHRYILVATDYFTKWVEAVPLKDVDQVGVIKFLNEHILHRFGIPESIVSDQA